MKRYFVFAFAYYYPCGGMNDFKGDFDTWEEAKSFIKETLKNAGYDKYQIFDSKHKNIVSSK